jgi:hypothetical protein
VLSARLLRLIFELLLRMTDKTNDPLLDAAAGAVDDYQEGLEVQEEPMRGIVLHIASDLSLLNATPQHKHPLSNGTDYGLGN